MNKLFTLILTLAFVSFFHYSKAQDAKYRRSSMTMVLAEDDGLGEFRDKIIKSYNSNPFPDKYNQHNITDNKFNLDKIKLTDEDLIKSGFLQDTLTTPIAMVKATSKLKTLRYLSSDSLSALVLPSQNEVFQAKLDKFIRDKNLAKQMVATWFNRDESGKMDWEEIKARGLYSASAQDMDDADSSADKDAYLLDFDLITNSFVVFNKMKFYKNEPVAAILRDQAKIATKKKMAKSPPALLEKALEALDVIYEETKVGYTVACNTFLYQLDWNEEIATKFKSKFFNDNVATDDKLAAWEDGAYMNLSLVGKTFSSSIVTVKIGEKRTLDQLIDLQVKRTMDNALAKLQKTYVVFRPITPITGVAPVTARIGMKEGIEAGDKFEVLESDKNELGVPFWKSVGKVSVDKKVVVWDNRAGAEAPLDDNGKPVESPEFSTFKGGKKLMLGVHFIRQSK